MLPKVLEERRIQIFKFWFGGSLQDGAHYHNELYYRALTVESAKRTRLYHLACKLSEQGGAVVVSLDNDQCSLWISLRDQALAHKTMDGRIAGLPRPSI
ncbi:hypothetical protein [Phormidium sp. FACHB-1136]|jgi:hypothetical protein|uniref:hypothetical protein n=1 Tax=Phormidium sp. FACHB-1136 TaxID=2692848 RepID=UPI00168A36B7|nr:hypothetical protein [Phormidium sp. FACHB-1136]MBD2428780.1 hypothetical protein [Phormidium sp. FACHB-1136]